MQRREINPTEWLQAFNINHGIEVTGAQRVLYLSGQTANAADGAAMHAGDLIAQFRLAWSNVKDSLAAAGMDPTNIVRLNPGFSISLWYRNPSDQFSRLDCAGSDARTPRRRVTPSG